jgi:hypothetical protein
MHLNFLWNQLVDSCCIWNSFLVQLADSCRIWNAFLDQLADKVIQSTSSAMAWKQYNTKKRYFSEDDKGNDEDSKRKPFCVQMFLGQRLLLGLELFSIQTSVILTVYDLSLRTMNKLQVKFTDYLCVLGTAEGSVYSRSQELWRLWEDIGFGQFYRVSTSLIYY